MKELGHFNLKFLNLNGLKLIYLKSFRLIDTSSGCIPYLARVRT
uniref:Uncharacterized protein n=1 Tax=Escherichia coli TaxID=562 RepID=A0A6G6ANV2_ECOLX|nr:hypothetical protein [Escherichia coli]QOE89369.1 hypothetical protein TP123_55 [Escherichia coli]UMW91682.1 hypothetical protein [Escherichia coli]UNS24868.1 hypothetical protein [Escherichia coli]WDZ04176.1 hypothetical protein [Escherichia coli]